MMKPSNWFVSLGVLLLASCGGSSDPTPVNYSRLVAFGDSLSDVGSYRVGTVAALGGGRYTVNAGAEVAQNWTELLAAQLKLPPPCAALTGLDGDAAQGFKVPATAHPGCTSYAQGGARVTHPVGPGNKLLGGGNAVLGQLTVPVVTQMSNHLNASGGGFKGDELVTVMAGGNDVFIGLATLNAVVSAGGDAATASANAVAAMGAAGRELADAVRTLVLAKGALRVVVVLLPDVSTSPFASSFDVNSRALLLSMTTNFNDSLVNRLAGTPVLIVDAHTASREQVQHPQQFGLSNATTPACDLGAVKNPFGSSLVCTPANRIPGETGRYLFADQVHPTPYGYQLLAQLVATAMLKKAWL
jgi:phospholipase/lecithinase/hemolysin